MTALRLFTARGWMIAGAIVAVLALAGACAIVRTLDPRPSRAELQARARSAEAATRSAAAAAAIGDARSANTQAASAAAEEARHAIQSAPDPDSALRAYRAGLDRVRAEGRRPLGAADVGRPDPRP